jgi:hypothetical protein
MAHAQKPDFVFRRNGWVHLNRRGSQFSRLLAAEVCASALVMLDTPRSEVVWEYWLPTPSASFPFTSPPVRHQVPSGFKRAIPAKCCTLTKLTASFITDFYVTPWTAVLYQLTKKFFLVHNPQVTNRVHNSPPSKPIFAIWIQPAASPLPCLSKIHFNKILPSKQKVSLAFRLVLIRCIRHTVSISLTNGTWYAHRIVLRLIILIILQNKSKRTFALLQCLIPRGDPCGAKLSQGFHMYQ